MTRFYLWNHLRCFIDVIKENAIFYYASTSFLFQIKDMFKYNKMINFQYCISKENILVFKTTFKFKRMYTVEVGYNER